MAQLKEYKPYRFYVFIQLRFLGLSKQPATPLLIPVEIKPAAATTHATASLWLRLPKGQALELPVNISPRWLAELLQCLG